VLIGARDAFYFIRIMSHVILIACEMAFVLMRYKIIMLILVNFILSVEFILRKSIFMLRRKSFCLYIEDKNMHAYFERLLFRFCD